ncbi:MAG TPA: hypothetical protein VHB98_12805, partial [Chloroflexota bacterium]|nr:hypothetical protein [Chloroflexota bacterium]
MSTMGFQVIRLTVTPAAAELPPGGRISLRVSLHNASSIVDRYHLSVDGVPADWYTLQETEFPLFPGTAEQTQLTLHPPAGLATAAGEYTLTVVARSEDDPTLEARTSVLLRVGQVGALTVDVLPAAQEGRDGAYRVTLHNATNQDQKLRVEARDAEDGLRFSFEPDQVDVPGGQENASTIHVQPKVKETIGDPHAYDVEVWAVDTGVPEGTPPEPQLVRPVRFIYRPRFTAATLPPVVRRLPLWALLALLGLMALLLLAAGNSAPPVVPRLVAAAQPTRTTLPSTPTVLPLTRTAVPSFQTAVPSTRTAAPPTRTAIPEPTPAVSLQVVPNANGTPGPAAAWDVKNAQSVTLNGTPVASRGVRPLSTGGATTLVLMARNAGGTVAEVIPVIPAVSAPITMTSPPQIARVPRITRFDTSRAAGGATSLTWSVTNLGPRGQVTLNGRRVAANASEPYTVTRTTAYTLLAANDAGSTMRRIVIEVTPGKQAVQRVSLAAPFVDFKLIHARPGQPYTLSWAAQRAVKVALNGQSVAPRGNLPLKPPLQSKRYDIVATDGNGLFARSTIIIKVQQAPAASQVVALALPQIVIFSLKRVGARVRVRWTVRNATRTALQQSAVPTQGQRDLALRGGPLQLTAANDVGQVRQILK